MKKWKLLTVLMAMMLLVLAACGSKDEAETDKGDSAADKPVEESTGAFQLLFQVAHMMEIHLLMLH